VTLTPPSSFRSARAPSTEHVQAPAVVAEAIRRLILSGENPMRPIFVVLLALCAVMPPLSACSKSEAQARRESASKPAAEHAAANVEPGSYEDWCGEHQVPESQCTLCNPSLSAAFKATRDWCDEHGLPESHCRKCNPELHITRPVKSN
jgi:hypothetical protein